MATFDYDRDAMWLQPLPHSAPRPFNRVGLEADKERDGSFLVWHVLAGSPAAAANIQVGDHIVAIDARPASQFSRSDFAALNAGPIGSHETYRVLTKSSAPRTVTVRLRELLS